MEILLIFFLVFINGFFVASEFSFVSIRLTRLDELVKEKRPLASVTLSAVKKLDGMLSVCQVGITVASILLGWVGEEYISHVLKDLLNALAFNLDPVALHSLSITISFSIITFLHIMLGELVPKTLAIQNTESIALFVAIPMYFFYYLFFPLTFVMNTFTSGLLKMFRLQKTPEKYVHSAEELMIILEEQSKRGSIDEHEMRLIKKTFDFSEHSAKDVMTHRLSIVAIPHDATIDKIIPMVAKDNFSRYPVYEESMDKIIGVLHVQTLIDHIASSSKNKKERAKALVKPPVFVPESTSIEKVMEQLRKEKQHMAIVIDEYGGVSGILTLEDIIEEIFGEIIDETDEEELKSERKKSKQRIIDGEEEIDKLKEELGLNTSDMDDIRTIAGYFLNTIQEMPKEGSFIELEKGELRVKKMEGNKIVSLQYIEKVSAEAKDTKDSKDGKDSKE